MQTRQIEILTAITVTLVMTAHAQQTWYDKSFFFLHEDHHTQERFEVGRDADAGEIARLLASLRPDGIQIHAKGNPGWTTYPTDIGYTPPKLARDVLGLWRDLARDQGFHWSIYYNIGRDGQIMERHPEWNRDRADGGEQDRALCYHSGVAEQYIWPMLDEIMAGYDPDGFWFDGSVFTIRTCYCEACRKRFRREHTMALPKDPDDPGWHAFHEMQREVYREFVVETCRRVHTREPSCLVSFNWAYSLRMPERPPRGIAYLTGDIANRVEGLSAEAHWADGVGLPFDLMTTGHTVAETARGRRRVAKPKPQLEQEMAVIIANGGRYNLWDNPSPTSRIDPDIMAHHSRVVTPFLRVRQAFCLGTERVPDASVLHSAAAHYALAEKGEAPFNRRNNRIDGLARFLPRLHLNYEILGDWRLIDQAVRSGVLIVEHPKVLSDAEVEALVTFAEGGGEVLLTGMGVTLRATLPERFGVGLVRRPDAAEDLTVQIGGESRSVNHHLFRVKALDADVLVQAVDQQEEAWPLLTRRSLGKGALWALTIPFFSSHGNNTPSLDLMREVMELVLPPADRALVTQVSVDAEVVLRRRSDGAFVYHVVNMGQGQRTEVVAGNRKHVSIHKIPPIPGHEVLLQLPEAPASVMLQPEGRRLAHRMTDDGRVAFSMPDTDIHAMAVIQF